MKKTSVESLAEIIKSPPPQRSSDVFFTGVSIDSRTVKAGDCFFAIEGENFDGHNYIAQAFDKGAVCAVVSKRNLPKNLPEAAVLQVDDTIKALGDFAGHYRRNNNFKVVAITGSVGKTTTRQIINHVLSKHFSVFESPKNFNNNIGVPLTFLTAETCHEIIIAELGSNHPGEIATLTQIAQPDIAVVTNVYPAHLEGFGDIETIAREKISIAQGLGADGTFIINADCERLFEACREKKLTCLTFGILNIADIKADNVKSNSLSSSFNVDGVEVIVPLPGRGNVENALAAWAVCRETGVTITDFAKALKSMRAPDMRAEILQIGPLAVLSDCYNANPASMKNALDILQNMGRDNSRRLVFICGDMAELGKQAEQLHAELGTHIAGTNIDLLIAVGNYAHITADAAKDASSHNLIEKTFADSKTLCNNLQNLIKTSDIVLVKGSRVNKLETVIDKLRKIFAD